MGVALSAPVVYDEPVKVRFRANTLGGWLLEGFCLLTVLIVPFIIALVMGGIWDKHGQFVATPKVVFLDKCLFKAQMTDGSSKLWGCSDKLEAILAGDERRLVPFFSIYSDDRDGDQKPDVISIDIEFDAPAGSVSRVDFLPAFHVKMSDDDQGIEIEHEAAPLISVPDVSSLGSSVVVEGRLLFYQHQPLSSSPYMRYDRVYNVSYFDDIVDIADMDAIGATAAKYARRNETLRFIPLAVYSGLSSINDLSREISASCDTFSLSIVLRVPSVTVEFTPSTSQVIKFFWVQYFCIAYVVHWIVWFIREFFVKQALINTIALWEGRKV